MRKDRDHGLGISDQSSTTRDRESGIRDQFLSILGRAPRKGMDCILFAFGFLTLSASLALPACPLRAQSPAASDVHSVAQLVDNHYNKLHSLRANFTESYSGLGMNRAESGTLLLLKPGRMRWDYSTPAGKLFLIDGKFAWFYTEGAQQVQRMAAKKLDDLRSPMRFLLGHTQVEKELDNLRISAQSHGAIVLAGQPKGQENRILRVTLTITPGTGAIQGIEIEEADGAITRFTFANEQTNIAIPESTFRFIPPAGVPVVDSVPTA